MGTTRADVCRRLDETVLRCCDGCETASSQLWKRIKSWRTAKRTVRSTNVTCDPIDKWSQRKPWNGTDEMQWGALTRSEPMRPLVAILEPSWSV